MINAIQWSKVEPLTMAAFLERFSLHDSGLVDLHLDALGAAQLTVAVDRHWNAAVPAGHDTLVLRFERAYSLRWHQGSWCGSGLQGAESSILDTAAREALFDSGEFDLSAYQGGRDEIPHPADDSDLTLTRVAFSNWGALEILHGRDVRAAVHSADDHVVDLSTLHTETA